MGWCFNRFLLLWALLAVVAAPSTARAYVSDESWATRRGYTRPEAVTLSADRVLIVTHVCTQWDDKCTTKPGNDETVGYAKSHRIPVIYLQHTLDESAYFCTDKRPDFIVYSSGG